MNLGLLKSLEYEVYDFAKSASCLSSFLIAREVLAKDPKPLFVPVLPNRVCSNLMTRESNREGGVKKLKEMVYVHCERPPNNVSKLFYSA